MSYEDLKAHNVFLPEPVWGKVDLTASVNQVLLSLVLILGISSCFMMWYGDGSDLTWWGAGLFVLFMYSFMWVSNTGIEDQNKEVDELIEKHR